MISHWQIVAHASEVASPGAYVLLPGPFGRQIVVSNFEGVFKVWDNRCPHRGMQIYEEPRGIAAPVCKYHGRCASLDAVGTYPTIVQGDWILAILDGQDGARMPDSLPPDGLSYFGRMDMRYECELHVAIENALDAEHVPTVHPNSLGRLDLYPGRVSLQGLGSSVQNFRSGISERLDKIEHLFVPLEAFEQDVDYRHAYVSPYMCVSTTRGFTYSLQLYIPQRDGHVDLVHRMYVAPHKGAAASFVKSAFDTNFRVFDEDRLICARVPGDVWGTPEHHEERIAHFREHYTGQL